MVWSLEALARVLPSGAKASPGIQALCPTRVPASSPVGTCQSFTEPSAYPEPEASNVPSGENASAVIPSACATNRLFSVWVTRSKKRMRPSVSPAASHLPSGENATAPLYDPLSDEAGKFVMICRVSKFQRRILRSLQKAARLLRSGANANDMAYPPPESWATSVLVMTFHNATTG